MNITTGAEINHTVKGDTYTREEIEYIRESSLSGRELAMIFNVAIENIQYVRNKANSIEKLMKYRKRHKVEGEHPLAPPNGDPDKLCGCCALFSEWRYYAENGIYGKCSITGEIMHRTDPCPCGNCYQHMKGCVSRRNGILAFYNGK